MACSGELPFGGGGGTLGKGSPEKLLRELVELRARCEELRMGA